MIEALRKQQSRSYTMEDVYNKVGISRQGHHQQIERSSKSLLSEADLVRKIKKWREKHPKMGGRIMYYSMREKGIEISLGVNKFEQIVSQNGLGAGIAKSKKPLTSDGKGRACYPNLTHGLILKGINELIVGDITYFDIKGQWHYIFTLKDVYSQHIVGLHAAASMQSKHLLTVLKACEKLRGSQVLHECIHHSDNGSQYNSNAYVKRLKTLKMRISRSQGCQENGSAEQLNHVVKNMYLNHWSIASLRQLQEACKEVQYLNNHERVIKQLGNRTPLAFEFYIKSLDREKRPIKELHDFNSEKK